MNSIRIRFALLSANLLFTLLAAFALPQPGLTAENWRPLFNGKDLTGWTPKIRGYAFGENYAKTFRVEDGKICVRYDGYSDGKFANRFGHLFYKEPFTNYVLRVEYRFLGEQLPDGPGWAFRNSGIMLHCQNPETMIKEQEFPVSIEDQLLGGDGKTPRSTCNVCSPGTHIVMGGKLITQHCNNSQSKTYHGDVWVTAEVEVHGNGKMIHRVNGETVLEYEQAQLDPGDPDAQRLLKAGVNPMISSGYVSLQSESHPCEFRKVEIRTLD